MFNRSITEKLIELANKYPVITLLGPRQSGKSTLVKHVFQTMPYINLETPEAKLLAQTDPNGFFKQFPNGAVIDEIQNVPELLSYIQVIVDSTNQNGMFILTGSHQLALHSAITQSLAGRTALLNLLPLSLSELKEAGFEYSLDRLIFTGGYPRIYANNLEPSQMLRDYYQTYVQRDVRNMINLKDLFLFEKFIKLCAGRIGQIFEASSLANEVGVSSHTINHWLSILEASFIIFRLQPYYENLGKRLIKSPKLYFTDTGLACYLLDIENPKHLAKSSFRGALFENLIISELMKHRNHQGKDHNLYFYRDHNKNEVDAIFKLANSLIPIEIKSAATFTKQFLKGPTYFKKVVGDRMPIGFIVYAGEQSQSLNELELINYSNLSLLWKRIEQQ